MDFDWDKFHQKTKKFDPIGHYAVDHAWKLGTRAAEPVIKATGNDWLINANQKDQKSIDRTIENSLAGAALVFGGMYGAGALGGGSGAAAGTGVGEAVGTGIGSGVGEAAGAGLGESVAGSIGAGEAGGIGASEVAGGIGASDAAGIGGYAEQGGGFVGNNEFLGSGGKAGMDWGKLIRLGMQGMNSQSSSNQSTSANTSGSNANMARMLAQLLRQQEFNRQWQTQQKLGYVPGTKYQPYEPYDPNARDDDDDEDSDTYQDY